ncbi:DEKNAAC104046 [Brettanomyces naardenensis]|uniref:DNA-directed RNA polymerase subunit n=1 Tax=Brettanomyces naardenensis TaxID=13370 RepID=A0A448YQF5_BRENA|nr:DEKNAAC104046 [Brettanomyces naardenensis]
MSVETAKRTASGLTSDHVKKQHTDPKITIKNAHLIAQRSPNPVSEDGLSKCFHRVRAELYLSIAPCFINDPIAGIKQQHLDRMLMSYSPVLNGVVITYFRIGFPPSSTTEEEDRTIALGKFGNDTPFSFIWCTVDFLVWSPQVGDTVEGWCYMQSQSHIGLLIHDTFNASIKKYNVPNEWEFVPSQADEEGGEGGEVVKDSSHFGKSLGQWVDGQGVPVEGKVRFRIKSLQPAGRGISIEGSMIEPEKERDTQPVTLGSDEVEKVEEDVEREGESSSDEDDSDSDSDEDGDEEESGETNDGSDKKEVVEDDSEDSSDSEA